VELLRRRLRTALVELLPHATAWSGACYRCAAPQWCAAKRFFDGAGARSTGGRWNPVGLRAAYASTKPEAALAESLASARRAGIADQDALPLVVGWGEVRLQRVLDLRSKRVRRRLKCTTSELLDPDWQALASDGAPALSQSIGAVAAEVGYEALLAPSAAVRGTVTLVVFPGTRLAGSRLIPHGLRVR
jgi:RES domain-containing protein